MGARAKSKDPSDRVERDRFDRCGGRPGSPDVHRLWHTVDFASWFVSTDSPGSFCAGQAGQLGRGRSGPCCKSPTILSALDRSFAGSSQQRGDFSAARINSLGQQLLTYLHSNRIELPANIVRRTMIKRRGLVARLTVAPTELRTASGRSINGSNCTSGIVGINS